MITAEANHTRPPHLASLAGDVFHHFVQRLAVLAQLGIVNSIQKNGWANRRRFGFELGHLLARRRFPLTAETGGKVTDDQSDDGSLQHDPER